MQTQVLVIGGGATGTAIARDLALRGVSCILVEQGELNAGASGGNHGLLHSGGRYVSNDQQAARECREEGEILKRTAPQLIDDTGGFFVAIEGDRESYIADFPAYCRDCGIDCKPVDIPTAREMEPGLSEKAIAVYQVPDASIDPFKLTIQNIRHAQKLGSGLLRRSKVIGFNREGARITSARVMSLDTGQEITIEAEQVVNAAGAWSAQITALAGIKIYILFSKGTLLITNGRVSTRIINRLRPPSDADIIVPGGTVSVVGTTSVRISDLDSIYPTVEETDHIVQEISKMMPGLESVRYIRAFSGVRPLVGSTPTDDDETGGRSVSRGFALIDHADNSVDNMCTITGGKLTTFRLMAEKTADLVCQKLGVDKPCVTAAEPLPAEEDYEWTEPSLSPRKWMRGHALDDTLVCDCEMVSKKALDEIAAAIRANGERPHIVDVGFRSRLGRGTCQGAFCGARGVHAMYDSGAIEGDTGIADLREFYRERWKGVHAILWGEQIGQAELNEAIHCATFGLELAAGTNKE